MGALEAAGGMGRSGQWGIKGSMLPLPFVYEGARPAAAGARGRIHAGGMTMKRRSWGVLAALALTLLLLTTGALAAGHTDHALCQHTGSSCKCPESAKSEVTWAAWNGTGDISYDEDSKTAYVYLSGEVTLDSTLRVKNGYTLYLCLNGHSITKTSDTSIFEGVITIENGGTLSLCNCKSTGTITHADGKSGRGVRCGNSSGGATFNMYSGEISGNHAGTSDLPQNGAGVEMYGGRFTMYGGKITDNKVQYESSYGGGGVCLHDGASFTMYGGEISRNTSAEDGGGVFAIGGASFVMQGGTISNNEATKCGGGLALYNDGRFELSGGIISGNTAANGGGVYGSNIFLPISGSVEIKNNKAAYGGGVYVNSGTVNMSGGEITGNTSTENGGGVFIYKNGVLNMTGGTIGGSATANANTAAYGGGVYVNAGTVNMSGGEITGNSVSGNSAGGGVYIDTSGTFTMSGNAEISRNTTDNNYGNGGGVCLNGGSFIMRSGSITGNTAGNGGGGVDAAAGTFTMTGGSITGNTASSGLGGGIHARIPLNMSGTPVIKDNKIGNDLNNVRLTDRNLIQLTAALGESAEIYVTPASAPTEGTPVVTIAEGEYNKYTATSSDMEKFRKDKADAEYEIALDAGNNIVMQIAPHTHKVCVGTDCADCSHDDVTWTGVSSLSNDMGKGNYYLTTNVKLSTTWTPADGTVLDLNGHSITMENEGAVINVTGTFTLTDCKGGVDTNPYGKITHKTGVKGSGVNIRPAAMGDATFTMYGGEISGNAAGSGTNGGGVYVGDPYETFIMLGGTITNNSAGFGGGGVYVGGGKFEMSGDAVITKNTANHGSGGGVYMSGSSTPNSLNSFTMSGNAKIAENTATQTGGGVYMNGGPNFTMNGGSIYKNTASGDGGGVYMLSGTFTMNDGNIYNNTATENGGGVCVNGGTFTMTNGTIGGTGTDDGNMALNGGGVYIGGGTFHMEQSSDSIVPSVYGNGLTNPTNGHGGGVYVNGTFEIAGNVHIDNNSDNVYLPGGEVIYITGDLKEITPIGVTLASMPAGTTPITIAIARVNVTLTDADRTRFFAQGDLSQKTYTVQLEDNSLKLYLGQPHKHPVCVGTDCTDSSHPDLSFRELTYDTFTKKLQYVGNNSSNQISGSPLYLYLKNDIEIDETITITENSKVTLCLNGHSITSKANGDAIKLENGATLTLCDCRGGDKTAKYGKITHHSTGRGRGVTLGDGSTFTMYGGSITGNTLIEQNAEGAGVYVAQNATFAMHGGSITSNTLSGQDAKGGGIFADAGSSLSVSGNVQVTSNGSSNLYLNHNEYGTNYSFVPITVTGELADTAKIGVTLVKSQCPANTTGRVNIAKATTEGWIKADNFVSDYNFYQMGVATLSNEQLAQLRLHDHTWGVRVKSAAEANILERYCTAFTNCPSTGGTLTLTANDAGFTGSAYAGASVSTDSWDVSDADRTIFYTNAIGGAAIEAPTKAGTYYANVTVDGVTATKEFKISRYKLSLNADNFIVEVPNNPTYDGDPKTVTKAEFKSDSIKQWFGEITVKYYDYDTNDPVDEPTNAGTYTVVLDVAAGDGYEAVSNISDTSWEFTILQDTQELSFGQTGTVEKVYGDGIFTITASHTKGDGRVSYESSDPSVATVAADGKVTIVGAGTTTITAKAAGTTNYQEATASYTLNVAQKDVTITGLSAQSRAYDGTDTATVTGTAVINGLVNNDDVTVNTTNATAKFADANVGVSKAVTFDGYALSGTKAANYKLTAQPASVTANIITATITVTPDASQKKAYGTADPTLTYDFTSAVNNEVPAFDGALERETGEDVGEYIIRKGSLTLKDNGTFKASNYELVFSTAEVKFAITPATITVTPDAGQKKVYGETDPELTYTYTGAMNGEEPAFEGALERAAGADVDSYAIGIGSLKLKDNGSFTAANYTLVFSATQVYFTIEQADPELKFAQDTVSITWGDSFGGNQLTNKGDGAVSYTSSDEKVATVNATTGEVTIVGAGETTITASSAATKNYKADTATYKLTVGRKYIELDIRLSANEFEYDGQPKTPGVTVYIHGTDTILSTEEYTLTHSAITKVGKTSVTIADNKSGNYSFVTHYGTFEITPRKLTMGASVTEKTYDGTAGTTVTPGALVGIVNNDVVSVLETSVNGTFDTAYVGTNKDVTLSQSFTLTGDQAGNYTLKQPTVTGNIIAADQEPAITATASVPRGGKTLDLSGLVTGVKAGGKVHFTISGGSEYATLNGSTLTTKDTVGTVKITVTIDAVDLNGDGKAEYNAYSRADAITVSVTLKSDSTVTTDPTGIDGLVYTGNDQTLIAAGTADGGELQYKLDDGTYSAALPTAKNAGDYTVWYKVAGDADHEDSQEYSLTVTIGKASATVRALDRRITAGQAAPDLSNPAEGVDYTVSGLIGADTLSGTASMAYYQNGSPATPDTGKSGTYEIRIDGLSNSNYDVQFVCGTLTIDPKPAQRLGIDAPGRTPGGSFELTPKNAKPGQAVTITVTPDEGYELGDLIVRDVGGENIPLTRESDDEFSFVMPKSSVRISVSFVREGDDGWFVDVPGGAYYYDAVKWAVEQGVTNGTDKTHYSPDGFCTRAQIVTFLWRAAGRPEPASLSSFVDVPADAYYAKAVAWAAELGIARGIDATHFDPDGICTRAHAVTFLARAAEAASGSGKTPFTDVSETAYYAPAVKWAAAGGVTAGVSATRFAPDRTCTRAQIVTFLYRFYTLA